MIIVKLGGSVITDKSKLRTFRRPACERLAGELSNCRDELVVVHGAGSFGHIEAKKHELHKGFKTDAQLEHVAAVQKDVRELNLRVIEALISKGLRAVSIPPAAAASFSGGEIQSFDKEPFASMLALGLVPVSFGDIVPDDSMGFSICSGDLMMAALAKEFRPRLAIFCADVDGVFDADPKKAKGAKLIPRLDRATAGLISRTEATENDVTGSIRGKLERMLAMAAYCEKCMIVNGNVPGRLEKALKGEEVLSTVVVPG